MLTPVPSMLDLLNTAHALGKLLDLDIVDGFRSGVVHDVTILWDKIIIRQVKMRSGHLLLGGHCVLAGSVWGGLGIE